MCPADDVRYIWTIFGPKLGGIGSRFRVQVPDRPRIGGTPIFDPFYSVFYIVIYYVKYTVKRVKNGGTPTSGPVQNLHRIGRANGAQKWAKSGPSVPHVINGVQMDHFGLVPSAPCVGLYGTSWDP